MPEEPPAAGRHTRRAALHSRRAALRSGITAAALGAVGTTAAGLAAAGTTAAGLGTAGTTAAAGSGQPRVFGTGEWGARPPTRPVTAQNHRPTFIVVHHTVNPGNTSETSRERAFHISRAIQNFHMDSRGWIDTGQQLTISRGGHITEGRHRSLDILREGTRHVLGANVGGHNSQIIGIENEGNYSNSDMPGAQWDALVDLVSYIAGRYAIEPEFIKGHRDFNSTACPGDALYARLPELRSAVARRQSAPVRSPLEWPLLRSGDAGEPVHIGQELLLEQAREIPEVPEPDGDGVFGPATRESVAAFAVAHGLGEPSCTGSARAGESGLLGADLWPLLVTGERSTEEWKRLLAQ